MTPSFAATLQRSIIASLASLRPCFCQGLRRFGLHRFATTTRSTPRLHDVTSSQLLPLSDPNAQRTAASSQASRQRRAKNALHRPSLAPTCGEVERAQFKAQQRRNEGTAAIAIGDIRTGIDSASSCCCVVSQDIVVEQQMACHSRGLRPASQRHFYIEQTRGTAPTGLAEITSIVSSIDKPRAHHSIQSRSWLRPSSALFAAPRPPCGSSR